MSRAPRASRGHRRLFPIQYEIGFEIAGLGGSLPGWLIDETETGSHHETETETLTFLGLIHDETQVM
jgi:hypothetical protein